MEKQKHDIEMLEQLQRETFDYFLYETNPQNGLVKDKTAPGWPSSIAATGMALACYPVAVERGYITREAAMQRTLITLRFLWNSPQGEKPDATGFKGFYYHFLDMNTGLRVWKSELSTVDTAFLIAGALTSAVYFDNHTPAEKEIRDLVDAIYRRVDWQWAQNNGLTLTHGWSPENGFLPYRWQGYDEALLLYILALGSPTFPISTASYRAWSSTYQWKNIYGYEYLFAGPLFIHQLSHIWIDFRGIRDEYMQSKGIDYFENSRRATYVQQQYAIRNPLGHKDYRSCCWGITASEGPGPVTLKVDGIEKQFFDYVPRGVPYGPDDGTLAPWAVAASLPFAPEIVLAALNHCIHQAKMTQFNRYGFKASFNPGHPGTPGNPYGWWVSPWHFGINQGPIILMIENYRTGLIWEIMKKCPYLVTGLQRAGFKGGWLSVSAGKNY
jgi:hypothetical protein